MDILAIAPEEVRTPIFTSYTFIHQEPAPVAKPLPPITQYIVKHLLTNQFFSKAALAKELHVSSVTINRWVNGTIKRPAHKTFSKLLMLYCASKATTRILEPTKAAA